MDSKDLTQNLPETETTKPTIETVLERVNAGFAALSLRMDGIESDIAEARNDIAELRKEMQDGFRRVERKIQLLNNDFLDRRADYEDILRRVESLENDRKAS
ncbi:MAG: hypothetical protein L0229_24160 [Blastocatellia bacterium]|nr:hypothetical protein [Blastocatellia bacterium]